jgi:hypothetical protein
MDLALLSRKELQALAKEHGLRANACSDELRASLAPLLQQAAQEPEPADDDMEQVLELELDALEEAEPSPVEDATAGMTAEELAAIAKRLFASPPQEVAPPAQEAAPPAVVDSPVLGLLDPAVKARRGAWRGPQETPLPDTLPETGAAPQEDGSSWCVALTPFACSARLLCSPALLARSCSASHAYLQARALLAALRRDTQRLGHLEAESVGRKARPRS